MQIFYEPLGGLERIAYGSIFIGGLSFFLYQCVYLHTKTEFLCKDCILI